MNGLDNIIEKIEASAEACAASIVADAEKEAARIIAEAEIFGDVQAGDIISAAKAECAAMVNKANSAGELQRRKRVLAGKVDIIDSTTAKAVGVFLREDLSRYFDGMIRLAEKHSVPGKCEMIFSDRDFARMPSDFEKRVNSAVKGSKITVRGGGGFVGGFLLVGDEVVENCTVEALLKDNETEMRDELCKLLFG